MNDEMADDQRPADSPAPPERGRKNTPTQFFLKGLAISLPPILTLVILIWIGQGIYAYVISPISGLVRLSFAQIIQQSQPANLFVRPDGLPPLPYCDRNYLVPEDDRASFRQRVTELQRDRAGGGSDARIDRLEATLERQLTTVAYVPFGDKAVPYRDYHRVAQRLGPGQMPTSVIGIYMELATIRYFQSLFNLSAVAVLLAIVLLYFLGRLVTVRLGHWAVTRVETVVLGRLPVISNVYSSVKQVTDFFFSERTIEYNRIVAIEYPRRGIYSLGFVTGDSMLEITAAAGEPLVSVLMPTSPMPMTGFTISVPRSQVMDLNITVDQAFQYCLSCGVLVPEQQKVTPELLRQELAKRLTGDVLRGDRQPLGKPPAASVPEQQPPMPGPNLEQPAAPDFPPREKHDKPQPKDAP